MGRPKLLLEVGGRTIIRRLVDVLQAGGVTAVYVLVRKSDQDLQAELSGTGARVVLTDDTPDMRASVEVLLEAITREESPLAGEGWLLCPADHPLLDPAAVIELLAVRRPGAREILVPVHAGRRGHPTYFPWELAHEVASLPPGCGVNRLLREHTGILREAPVQSPAVLFDLDTPEDLERLQRQAGPATETVCGQGNGSLTCRSH